MDNKMINSQLDKLLLDDTCKYLEEGEAVYINHFNCPAGKDIKYRRWVKRTDTGFSTYCHHCGEKKYYNSKLRKSMFHTNTKGRAQKANGELPPDFTTNIPTEGLLWLFKYDITLKEIERHGIGYSAYHNCVVLPVTRPVKMGSDVKHVIYWQGRRLGDKPGGKKKGYYCPRNVKQHNFYSTDKWSDTLVLVEDYISAIKVGRVCKTVALFGTKIPNDVWQTAIRSKKVIVWLDKDTGSKPLMYVNNLELYTKAYPIITNEDPKCYSDLEIQKLITNCHN